MKDVLAVQRKRDIPEINIYQCGTCRMHSLKEAKKIARSVLDRGIKRMKNRDLALDPALLKGATC